MNDIANTGAAGLRRSIDCPIPWCMGEARTHGADGSAPDEWEHHGQTVPVLARGLESHGWIARAQFGSEPAGWSGHIVVTNDLFEQGPTAAVAALRSAADEIERWVWRLTELQGEGSDA